MKKLIFLLLLIVPIICSSQGYWGSLQKFLDGIQVGDSIAGSKIRTIDSITVDGTNIHFWIDGAIVAYYNSGSGITIDGNKNIDLGGALDAPTTITGTEVNNLSINMSDASDRSTKLVFRPADGLSMRAYTGDDHTGDSSFVTVDSNLVSMGIYDGVLIKSIVIDESGMIITDNVEGKGLSLNEDYSAAATSLNLMPRIYIDENLGGQDLDANVYSPAAANHGDVLVYDSNGHYNGTDTYKLQATNPITSTARVGLRAMDTILFSRTTADTIVILPVATVIDKILVYIETAFNGSGTNLLDVGISTDGDKYENDLDLEDTSFEFYELANLSDRTASTVYVTYQYTDSGADASTGFAIVYVYYTIF